MPPSRTVFVANIPYDVSEEQIASVFSEVGPVNNVEIKFDPQTGRSKGYAFVTFYDEATAHSAVRNLQDIPINGRPVRVELSSEEGPRRGGRSGGVAGAAGALAGGYVRPRDDTPPPRGPAQGFGRDDGGIAHSVDLNLLPPGQDPLPGQNATDAITKTLSVVNPGQMQDVMASMKSLIATHPEDARQLLTSQPQVAYALFQAMLLTNIVEPSVLQRIQPLPPAPTGVPTASFPSTTGHVYPAYPPPPVQSAPPPTYPPYPPAAGAPFRPPPNGALYNAPPAPQQTGYPVGYPSQAPPVAPPALSGPPALPQATQAALAGLPEDQRTMLMQVLQLTPDQISALDPTQQQSIQQLRQQFLGVA